MGLSNTIHNSRFFDRLTRWDKLLGLLVLLFLFLFLVPENPHYMRVVGAAIVAIIGIFFTTYVSHRQETSYTSWPYLVLKKNYGGNKFKRYREFYLEHKTEIDTHQQKLPTIDKWNDTQWQHFRDWADDKIKIDEALDKMEKAETKRGDNKSTRSPILVFGFIYAFIAGWALVQPVLAFSCTLIPDCSSPGGIPLHDQNFLGYLQNISNFNWTNEHFEDLLIFLSFYPIAIIFYHSGAIFLSSDAAALITENRKGRTLANFGVILADGMILYLMSERATHKTPEAFVSLVLLLMAISIVWVLVFRYLDTKENVVDWPVYMEWLYFDLFILIFCIVFLAYPDDGQYSVARYLSMFCVFAVMAICNYHFAWKKLWEKFQTND